MGKKREWLLSLHHHTIKLLAKYNNYGYVSCMTDHTGFHHTLTKTAPVGGGVTTFLNHMENRWRVTGEEKKKMDLV